MDTCTTCKWYYHEEPIIQTGIIQTRMARWDYPEVISECRRYPTAIKTRADRFCGEYHVKEVEK